MANQDVLIRIGAELAEFRKGLDAALADVRKFGREAGKAGRIGPSGDGGLGRMTQGIAGAVTQVRALAGALAALYAGSQVIRMADDWANLTARLKLATKASDDYVVAQERIFQISQKTGQAFNDTASLFAQISLSLKDTETSQETLLQITETINQAVALSGASRESARAALVQLGQGLASGTLRGEELNSVLEQTPALADAIAKGMGITRGELRKYGEEGKITGEQVVKALLAQKQAVDEQFAGLPLTFSRATQQLANSFARLVGIFDETAGATGGLAKVISDFAAFIASDEFTGSVIELANVWGDSFARMVDDINEAIAIIKRATDDWAGSGEDAVGTVTRAFMELPVNLRAAVKTVATILAAMTDRVMIEARLIKEAVASIFTIDPEEAQSSLDAAIARRASAVAAATQAGKDQIDDILAERDKSLADAKKTSAEAVARREAARNARGDVKVGAGRKTPGKGGPGAGDYAAAELKLIKDATERALKEIENLYDDAKIATESYINRRVEIQLAAIEKEIAAERKKAAENGKERVKAEAEITLLERRKTDIVAQGERDRERIRKETAAKLEQVEIRLLELNGQGAEAARRNLEGQFKDLLARLAADGNEAGVALINNLINTEVARARFNELKEEYDRVLQDLQLRQQSLQNQTEAGALPRDVAATEVQSARQRAIEQLTVLNDKMRELAETTNDPRIKQGAEEAGIALQRLAIDSATGIDAAIIQLRKSLELLDQQLAATAASAGVDALTGLFDDLVSGTKSAKEALQDFVLGFVRSMATIAARALATYLVLQLLDAVYPGLGKAVSAGMGAGVKHSGGIAGQGGTIRQVNPLIFAGAPRYHNGGVAGLAPDEVPAILKKGEEVVTQADPRHRDNGGGQQQGQGVRIVNVLDSGVLTDAMGSAAGEKVILNVIERNAAGIKQRLA